MTLLILIAVFGIAIIRCACVVVAVLGCREMALRDDNPEWFYDLDVIELIFDMTTWDKWSAYAISRYLGRDS